MGIFILQNSMVKFYWEVDNRSLSRVLFQGILFVSMFNTFHLFAQDTIKTSSSVEFEEFVKQRFIDKYENVFMTKIPSKHMLKVNLAFNPSNFRSFNQTDIQNITYEIGYEYKVLPAFSVALNFAATNPYYFNSHWQAALAVNAQVRWYYEMNKRIRQGKNANNFSGNYVAAIVEKRWRYDHGAIPLSGIGIEFGMQRRFLNRGRMEFGIGVFYQHYRDDFFKDIGWITGSRVSEFVITSKTNFGLAFGDWKREKNQPLCEIINCEQYVGQQWKVLWPSINIGTRLLKGTFGLSYEKKIGKSPVSVNAQIFADYRNILLYKKLIVDQRSFSTASYQIQPSLQIRYYYFQKRNIRRGSGGNNLSGLYAGPYSDYVKFSESKAYIDGKREHFGVGFVAGYQKTFLKNAYMDIFGTQSWNVLNGPGRPKVLRSFRIGFGLAF